MPYGWTDPNGNFRPYLPGMKVGPANSDITYLGNGQWFVPAMFGAGGGGVGRVSAQQAAAQGGTPYTLPGKPYDQYSNPNPTGATPGYVFTSDPSSWAVAGLPTVSYTPGVKGSKSGLATTADLATVLAPAVPALFAPGGILAGAGSAVAGAGAAGSAIPAGTTTGATGFGAGEGGLLNVGTEGAGAGVGLGFDTAGLPAGATLSQGGITLANGTVLSAEQMASMAPSTLAALSSNVPAASGLLGGGGVLGTGLTGGQIASGVAAAGGLYGLFNGNKSTSTQTVAQTPQQQAQAALGVQLTQAQLASLQAMTPFQQQQFLAAAQAQSQGIAEQSALNTAIPPADQAAQARQGFDYATASGTANITLLEQQMAALAAKGMATPEQLAYIKQAADASIAAGTGDINAQTKTGIGLIADELSNARGLRLSDAPMNSAAAIFAGKNADLVANLTNTVRAQQAQQALDYPIASLKANSVINQGQQALNNAVVDYQAQLRQQAYQNRLALTGQTGTAGIGLAGIGGTGTTTPASTTTNSTSGITGQQIGQFASGIGALSDYWK